MTTRNLTKMLIAALLLAAGQGRDNLVSTEEVVIKDTFTEIRKALGKN